MIPLEPHAKGIQVRLYNTIRELTYRAHELFALLSLGDEILNDVLAAKRGQVVIDLHSARLRRRGPVLAGRQVDGVHV